jgi:hypothetical protein
MNIARFVLRPFPPFLTPLPKLQLTFVSAASYPRDAWRPQLLRYKAMKL